MQKIFHSLKGMRPRVGSRPVTFFLLLSVLHLCLIGFPGGVSAQVPVQIIDIPDPNLRAAIAQALNKAPTDNITRAEMETLDRLNASYRDITDLRGIESAINLTWLYLLSNAISDISPLSSLTNLTDLNLARNTISDISPLSTLTNLTRLELADNTISDISPLSSLTRLRELYLHSNEISDISSLSNLINLTRLELWLNEISDISSLSNLTNLTSLSLSRNNISNIVPLIALTRLRELYLHSNEISDISSLSNLTNLTHLDLSGNNISDIETLERLMAQGTVVYFSRNPAFETPGPEIEDGWVWLIVPATRVRNGSQAAGSGRDFLSEASGGTVTEADVAFNGASAGTQVGNSVWTPAPLDATDSDNLNAIVTDYDLGTDIRYPVAYGVASIQSETPQQTRVYIGGGPVKVYLNGTLVYKDTNYTFASDYETAVPVTLNPGENVLFIAAYRYRESPLAFWAAFFGFQDGTGYTVGPAAPGAGVDIPDPNLRAAIAQALGKAPTDAITRADMETLNKLGADSREITDLRGIESAINLEVLGLDFNAISDISPLSNLTNLTRLFLRNNNVSDISALESLINLIELNLWGNNISDISALESLINLIHLNLENNTLSDISAVAGLTNLTRLHLWRNTISDVSAVAGLTNLTGLYLGVNTISDISAVAGLTNLEHLWLGGNTISDITPLASLTNLKRMQLSNNTISDISPLASLTNLTYLELGGNTISDISPLASLTNLTYLHLWRNTISELSPLASLINLTYLNLGNNNISDIVPLITLTNLTHLHVHGNTISDIETLERLMAQGTVVYFRNNPAFETPGPKIEDGWVWLVVPATGVNSGSHAAGSGRDFLLEASGGTVSEADVAFNGASAGTQIGNSVWTPAPLDATDPNNLNTLVQTHNLGTEILYPVAYGVASIQSGTHQQTRAYIGGGPVKVWLNGTAVHRDTTHHYVNNYQTAVPVTLNPGENVLFIAAYRPYPWENWGAFFGFQDGTEYTVEPPAPGNLDVNGDGRVDVLDLVQVALFYGKRGDNLPEDINADGVINVPDLVAVAEGIDATDELSLAVEQALLIALGKAVEGEAIAEAPMRSEALPGGILSPGVAYHNVAAALADAKHLTTRDVRLGKGVQTVLEKLLHLLAEIGATPETTALLPNYPNPFNPETWMPYQLSTPSGVTLSIYSIDGRLVRTLDLGHQPAGVYQSKYRAAYWDGRNQLGEPVASGLYFYTLTAGDFTATRKMLIAK